MEWNIVIYISRVSQKHKECTKCQIQQINFLSGGKQLQIGWEPQLLIIIISIYNFKISSKGLLYIFSWVVMHVFTKCRSLVLDWSLETCFNIFWQFNAQCWTYGANKCHFSNSTITYNLFCICSFFCIPILNLHLLLIKTSPLIH